MHGTDHASRSTMPPPQARSSINDLLNPKYKSPAPKQSSAAASSSSSHQPAATSSPSSALFAHFTALKEKLKLSDIITPPRLPRDSSSSIFSIPSPTISVTSPYALKGNQSPSYVKPVDSSIPAIAQAAQNTPYKPFQTMTDPNFIQLLVAFSKSGSASQAGFLDDTDDQKKDDSPTSIDARVQQRLIQWGLTQKHTSYPLTASSSSSASKFLSASSSSMTRGGISPSLSTFNSFHYEFQVPAPSTSKLAAARAAQLTKQLDEKKQMQIKEQQQFAAQQKEKEKLTTNTSESDSYSSYGSSAHHQLLQSPTSSSVAQALLGLEQSNPNQGLFLSVEQTVQHEPPAESFSSPVRSKPTQPTPASSSSFSEDVPPPSTTATTTSTSIPSSTKRPASPVPVNTAADESRSGSPKAKRARSDEGRDLS